jgi:hypothetical protein
MAQPDREPVILTNSLGGKVRRHLATLELEHDLAVLGDTRQYDMDPDWDTRSDHPELGGIQIWPISKLRQIDLRRPIYYQALMRALEEDPRVVVVADTLSLPGALPLMMGLPFFLVRTRYTPDWCARVTDDHRSGRVLEDLAELPVALDTLASESETRGDDTR